MLNTAPNLFTLRQVVDLAQGADTKLIDNRWEPCRPFGFYSICHRVKCAWMVFTGRADAVTWPGDQMPKAY